MRRLLFAAVSSIAGIGAIASLVFDDPSAAYGLLTFAAITALGTIGDGDTIRLTRPRNMVRWQRRRRLRR